MGEPIQVWKNNPHLFRRLRKTLYFGHTKKPLVECSSLPLTEVTVDFIEKSIAHRQRSLGNLDVSYASHILHQASISPFSIMVAMVYLDRLKANGSDYLQQATPSELFLVSLVIASKFLFDRGEDEIVYNDEWAVFSSLDLDDLNRIEREFLAALDWSCFVDVQSFMDQLTRFEGLVSMKECLKRPDSTRLTYTEILSLFEYIKYCHKNDLTHLWTDVVNFGKGIGICTLAYCAALGILAMSFSIVFSLHLAIISSQFHQQQHKLNSADNFTLMQPTVWSAPHHHHDYLGATDASPVFAASNLPTKSAQILETAYFVTRPNLTTDHFDNHFNKYHILLKQKPNKVLKCS